MKKNRHIITGLKGEELALQYLKEKGYRILYQRWKFKHKEIDIIAQKDDTLIIVEVKTRTSDFFIPEDSVDSKKQQFLIEATEWFSQQYSDFNNIRFDIIAITTNNNKISIRHIENAFIPGL
ncbi:MAG: YraN family protein [Bacteroidales bacterium]|nr:YraN family protein [Bacteroidales bacterium]